MTVTVSPIGGTPTVNASTLCSTVACTVNFTTTPGPTLLSFSFTDGVGTVLSRYSTTVIVQPPTINTLNFSANPVVKTAALIIATTPINAGTPTNDALTLQAKDPDGNTIIGNKNYIDTNGNPVAFTLSVSNNQAGGRGTVSIKGQTFITAPGQTPTYAYYDGNWLASSTISLSSSSSAITSLSGVTIATTPTITKTYTMPAGTQLASGITTGPDGNIWITEGDHSIVRMMMSGPLAGTLKQFNIASNAFPTAIMNGLDGNLWFTECPPPYVCPGTGKAVGRITTNGVVTEFATPNGGGMDASGTVNYETIGPDGNIWFSGESVNAIYNINTSGKTSGFAMPSTSAAITTGPDGNLWVGQDVGSKIWRVTTSGGITPFTIPGGRGNVGCLVAGPDGNIWFGEENGNKIGRITPAGTISEFTLPLANSFPLAMIVGPDQNLWFVDISNSVLGQITTGGVIMEYTLPGNPAGLTIGPDGNIWVTQWTNNTVSKFVY